MQHRSRSTQTPAQPIPQPRGMPSQMMRALQRVSLMLPRRHPLSHVAENEVVSDLHDFPPTVLPPSVVPIEGGTFVGRIFVHGREVAHFSERRPGALDMLVPVQADENGAVAGNDTCAVCLRAFAELDDLVVLPNCMHSFCRECIVAWIKINPSCPTCRTKVV